LERSGVFFFGKYVEWKTGEPHSPDTSPSYLGFNSGLAGAIAGLIVGAILGFID